MSALSKLSVGAQRIHDGLCQQVAPGRRRVDVTGKRRGRQHDEQSCRTRVAAKGGGGGSKRAEPVGNDPSPGQGASGHHLIHLRDHGRVGGVTVVERVVGQRDELMAVAIQVADVPVDGVEVG